MSDTDFSLLDWIETGTTATRTVTHYNDQAAYADYLDWQRRYEDAEKESDSVSGERSMGTKNPLIVLEEEGQEILDRLQGSKAVWVVRALSNDELQAIDDEFPVPSEPVAPGRGADEGKWRKYREYLNGAYKEKLAAALTAQQFAILVKAFVKVETPRGVIETVTAEEFKKLNSYPHGGQLLKRLADAVKAASQSEVEIAAPKSQSNSDTSQDS